MHRFIGKYQLCFVIKKMKLNIKKFNFNRFSAQSPETKDNSSEENQTCDQIFDVKSFPSSSSSASVIIL